MGRAHALYFHTSREALKEIIRFIVRCLAAGGVPIRRRTNLEGEYVGATWVCQGASDVVPSVRIYAPAADSAWVELNQYLDSVRGDWKYVLSYYPQLVAELMRESSDFKKLLRQAAEHKPEVRELLRRIAQSLGVAELVEI